MSVTLKVTFTFGRYHATPWGRSPNEGFVDWPPAPWRLLRALYASWQRTAGHLDTEEVAGLLHDLAPAPEMWLPEHRQGHTRHYLPSNDARSGLFDQNLVFDNFVSFDATQPLVIHWPAVELDGPRTDMLAELAGGIRHLGRAESQCDVVVADLNGDPGNGGVHWRADTESSTSSGIELLAWAEPYSVEELIQTPDQVRKGKRLIPSGSRLVSYQPRTPRFENPTPQPVRTHTAASPAAIVWALTGEAPGSAAPPVGADKALQVCETLRVAALHHHARRSGAPDGKLRSEFLSGRRGDQKSTEQHQHAHYLALPLGPGASRITHVAIWAPGGVIDQRDRSLIGSLVGIDRLWPPRGRNLFPNLRLSLLGIGALDDLLPTRETKLEAETDVFQSLTPYVPTRYPKGEPTEAFLRRDIARELSVRGKPGLVEVEVVDSNPRLHRRRITRPDQTVGPFAAMLRVTLTKPSSGPLSLGRFSHFGLGLFHASR